MAVWINVHFKKRQMSSLSQTGTDRPELKPWNKNCDLYLCKYSMSFISVALQTYSIYTIFSV